LIRVNVSKKILAIQFLSEVKTETMRPHSFASSFISQFLGHYQIQKQRF